MDLYTSEEIEEKERKERKKRKILITFAVISGILLIASSTYAILWYEWIYPKEYEYALRLADDSSLPEQKALYLREYLNKVKTITGEPRYIFKKPDLNKSKQIAILEGLIKRFEDLSKLDPSSMAYQQGMYQLTGQEIDHQLDRISGIFQSAKLRENFINFFVIAVLPLLSGLYLLILVIKFFWDY